MPRTIEEVAEPFEPEDDDLTTIDHARFYQGGKLCVKVSPDASTAEMWAAIDKFCKEEQFWPNVWFLSDHGNAHLMTREFEKVI